MISNVLGVMIGFEACLEEQRHLLPEESNVQSHSQTTAHQRLLQVRLERGGSLHISPTVNSLHYHEISNKNTLLPSLHFSTELSGAKENHVMKQGKTVWESFILKVDVL